MTRKTWLLAIIIQFLAISWVASAWTLPEELHDIADEIGTLAEAVPQHPFEQRALLGKEVDITLPQLRDRLDEVQERIRHEAGGSFESAAGDLANIQWDIKDLETRLQGIAQVQEEPAYLVMREEMRQGLEGIDESMDAIVNALGRSGNRNFAH